MKKFLKASILCLLAIDVSAETYQVNVTRDSMDDYKVNFVSRDIHIKTRFCSAFPVADDAILIYEDNSFDNKIIFPSENETCEVEKVIISN